MTRKEEVHVIIKDKADKVEGWSIRIQSIDWRDDESENMEKLRDYKTAMQSLMTYIDELETLTK
jgi:hypothetical protein